MQISEIAKRSWFSRDTLRYYEKIGLIKMDKKKKERLPYGRRDKVVCQLIISYVNLLNKSIKTLK